MWVEPLSLLLETKSQAAPKGTKSAGRQVSANRQCPRNTPMSVFGQSSMPPGHQIYLVFRRPDLFMLPVVPQWHCFDEQSRFPNEGATPAHNMPQARSLGPNSCAPPAHYYLERPAVRPPRKTRGSAPDRINRRDNRTHLGLNKDTPLGRSVQHRGRITSMPKLGGLHHAYVRI